MTSYGRQKDDPITIPLFHNVKYYIDRTLSFTKQKKLDTDLQNNGAERVENESDATHIFSIKNLEVSSHQNIPRFIVLPLWVERAIKNNFVHHPKFYSADPLAFFSGMVVATGTLPHNDRVSICAAMRQFGGQFMDKVSSETTLYITVSKKEASQVKEKYNVRSVLPHYIDQCVKYRRCVRTDQYEFPEPKIAQLFTTQKAEENRDIEKSKKDCYESIGEPLIFPPHDSQFNINKKYTIDLTQDPPTQYLAGECLFVEPDLINQPDTLAEWLDYLQNKAGATIAKEYTKEKVTIAVVKDRSTDVYRQASKDQKTVASKWWLTNTIMRKELCLPTLTLVDYPMPRGGIQEAEEVCVTICGYKDTARDYLRRLAIHCGMNISSSLTKKTTHLICNSKSLEKWSRAKAMDKVVVNHIWLEDCFRDWIIHPINDEKYIHFPGGAMMRSLVGTKAGLRLDILSRWWGDEKDVPIETKRKAIGLPMTSVEQQSHPVTKSVGLVSPLKDRRVTPYDPIHGPRKAKQNADDVLRETMIPDLNAYNKQQKGKRSQTLPRSSSSEKPDSKNATKALKSIKESSHEDIVLSVPSTKKTTSSKRDHMDNEEGSIEHNIKKSTAELTKKRQKCSDSSAQPTPVLLTTKTAKRIIILFTGITENITTKKRKIQGLGNVGVTDDVKKATHLVAPNKILRTPKFLSAMNLGLTIATEKWIDESLKANELLPADDYLLQDINNEKRYKCNLLESSKKAKEKRQEASSKVGTVFNGYTFYLLENDDRMKLDMKLIVETGGGEVVQNIKRFDSSNDPSKCLVIAGAKNNEKRKGLDLQKKGYNVYTKDVIIDGSLRQSMDSLEDHVLCN